MGKRLSKLERQRKEYEDAAYASIGAAFVKLLRDENAPKRKRETALKLADWLHLNKLTKDEARFFMVNTGIVFDSDLLPDPNYQPPPDYLRPEKSDMTETSAKQRQSHRLRATNATELKASAR